MHPLHRETHLVERIGWLRAAVLGANDGIISTASLVVGIAAAGKTSSEILVVGVAGLVAGAMSMAAGEYVSVASQADTEAADAARERRELVEQPEAELAELTRIYVDRGVDEALARQVAAQMMAKDAFAAHARDELGFTEWLRQTRRGGLHLGADLFGGRGYSARCCDARTVQPSGYHRLRRIPAVPRILGALGARIGGAPALTPAVRVTFWGAVAMGATAAIGALTGHVL